MGAEFLMSGRREPVVSFQRIPENKKGKSTAEEHLWTQSLGMTHPLIPQFMLDLEPPSGATQNHTLCQPAAMM